jgi:hypothetical protein
MEQFGNTNEVQFGWNYELNARAAMFDFDLKFGNVKDIFFRNPATLMAEMFYSLGSPNMGGYVPAPKLGTAFPIFYHGKTTIRR